MKSKIQYDARPQQLSIISEFIYLGIKGMSVGSACDEGLGADLRKRISELKEIGYVFGERWEPNKYSTGRHKV